MLRHLAIKDFAVVRAAELEFGEGMTVISGETGAGKSLLVDALGFLSGLRADSGVVRHGAERAELSAEFSAPSGSPAQAWLADNELDDEGQCQLRRVIRADGGSRAWINGRSVTLSQLAELAGRLVEIHGQHEHQALLARNSQLDLLDAFARNDAERARVREAARAWSALLQEREQLSGQGDVSDRINYLEHQLAELQREDLSPAALEQLVASHRRQAHATGLIQACDAALGQLAGDDTPSLTRQLQQVRADLARQAEHEPRLRDVDGLLDGAAIQIEEALSLLGQVRDDLDAEPLQFDALERKLARVHDLARKHRVPLEGLQEQHDRLAAELDGLRVLRAGELPRVAVLEPVVRLLDLLAVHDALTEGFFHRVGAAGLQRGCVGCSVHEAEHPLSVDHLAHEDHIHAQALAQRGQDFVDRSVHQGVGAVGGGDQQLGHHHTQVFVLVQLEQAHRQSRHEHGEPK